MVQEYSRALDLITDNLGALPFTTLPNCSREPSRLGADGWADDEALDDDVREAIETNARFLYGLIHARYIITSRGLAKMVCPRALPGYCTIEAG